MPVINARCLHDFLFFMVYRDLVEGIPVVEYPKCVQPFFKRFRRGFCGDMCANAYSQSKHREKVKERKNPRPSEEP